MAALSDWRILF